MVMHNTGANPAVKAGRAVASALSDGVMVEAGPPVFVDATGRRERWWRRAGLLVAAVATGYVVAVGTNLLAAPVEPQAPPVELDGARAGVQGEHTAPPALRVETD